MKYNVVVHYVGEAEMEIEANSPEEAVSKANMEFSSYYVDGGDLDWVEVYDEDADEMMMSMGGAEV